MKDKEHAMNAFQENRSRNAICLIVNIDFHKRCFESVGKHLPLLTVCTLQSVRETRLGIFRQSTDEITKSILNFLSNDKVSRTYLQSPKKVESLSILHVCSDIFCKDFEHGLFPSVR